jgi:Flp pilus assembly protein TadD/serine/threonine protein kinase
MSLPGNGRPDPQAPSQSVVGSSGPGPDDPRVIAALEEYAAALKAGGAPDRQAFLARHPEIAAALAECLGGLDCLRGAAPAPAAAGLPGAAGSALPGTPLGDYRVVREVGRGGMGVVYEAVQLSLDRRVALKVLPFAAALDPRQLQRFKNEAHAAAQLHHTNIVPVFGVGCERGVHYYAMQFIEGQTLAALIAELRQSAGRDPAPEGGQNAPPSGPVSRMLCTDAAAAQAGGAGPQRTGPYLPEAAPTRVGDTTLGRAKSGSSVRSLKSPGFFRAVAQLGIQAAEALEHAHQLGVVHRDIKPGNLLVQGEAGASTPGVRLWVTDFGLAHCQSQARLTMTGDLVGTLRYMSPEQALAKRVPVDHRTDVYSLGATLYELLTLEPVFPGRDRQELLRQIAFDEPRPPRRLNRAIPSEVETVVLKALEKNPADRYATAQELADDLERFLKDEPIRARRPTLVQRARKWARRHKAVVWAAAMIVLLVAMMAGGSGLWFMQKRAQTAGAVNEALNKATDLRTEGKWPEALAVAQRAEALLQLGGGSPVLRHRVEQLVNDIKTVADLEEIQIQLRDSLLTGSTSTFSTFLAAGSKEIQIRLDHSLLTGGDFDPAKADADFARKFAQYGIDLTALEPGEAARRIQASAIQQQLLAAVACWVGLKESHRIAGSDGLREVFRQADPAAWRDQLGQALASKDQGAVQRVVRSREVMALPAGRIIRVAEILAWAGKLPLAVEVLRQAQRRHSGDFWVNHTLALYLYQLKPSQGEEAIRFFTAAVALRPNSPGAHCSLGNALRSQGKHVEAEAEYREALRLRPDYFAAHNNLGIALSVQEKLAEAEAEYREALRLRPDSPTTHYNLGHDLRKQEKLAEAEAEYREALRLRPDYPEAHLGLGNALLDQGKLAEAEAEYREELRLRPHSPEAHCNLGNALRSQGKHVEAEAECREALRLRPDFPEAHGNLGVALFHEKKYSEADKEYRKVLRLRPGDARAHNNLGCSLDKQGRHAEAVAQYREAVRLGPDLADVRYNLAEALERQGNHAEAEAEYREVLRLQPEYPEAYCNLGHILRNQGCFAEALAHLRRGHELGSRQPDWRFPSAEWARQAEQLIALDAKVSEVLQGQAQPAGAVERLVVARMCQTYKKRYVDAARFYAEVFAVDPKWAADLSTQHRYKAACAAALAGCGQGIGADKLDDKERGGLRRQALAWLRADLAAWGQVLEKQPDKARAAVQQTLHHWQQDGDFAGVRADALAKLPEAERQPWRQLWAEVEQTLRKADNQGGKRK